MQKWTSGRGPVKKTSLLQSKSLGSSHELHRGADQDATSPASPASPQRSKVRTNGHLIPYMQVRLQKKNK